MLKRILALSVCLCLAAAAIPAMAEPANVTLLTQQNAANAKSVTGAAAIGDTVYVLTNETLERWQPGETEATPMPLAITNTDYNPTVNDGVAAINRLFTDSQTLYGINTNTGAVWKLADSTGILAKAEKAVPLVWDTMARKSAQGGYDYTPQFTDYAVMDGVLYVALTDWEQAEQPYELCGWDLATGKLVTSYPGLAIRTIAPYKDGLLICKLYDETTSWDEATQTQKMPQLATCNPKTGETTVLFDFTSTNIYGVRYDSAKDTLYYVDGATVYRMAGLQQPAVVSAYLPNRVWDNGNVCLLPGGMYMVADYNGLVVRGLDMPGIENGALTVYGEYGSSGHLAYVEQYPQAAVTCSDQYFNTLEEFTAAMVSGSNTVDVLRLNSDYTPISRLIDKGYALDLSAYPALTEIASRMDPNLVNLCMRDGKLYGLPVDVSGYSIGYSKPAWETLGLTEADLPANFMELLDFVANWQADYGEDHPDMMLTDNGVSRDALVTWLMDAYVAEQVRAGQLLSFDTELFRTLMTKLDSIDFSEIDVPYDEQNNEEYWSRQAVFSTSVIVTYPNQFRYDMKFIPMPLAEGLTPVMPTTVEFMIINPRTAHLEQAVQYLSVFANNLDPTAAAIVLYPDNNEPILDPYLDANKAEWEKDLADSKAKLETAPPEEQADLKDLISYYESMIADADANMYSVSTADIKLYRDNAAPYLVVTGQTPLKTWDSEGNNQFYTLRDQYLQGAQTLDQFVKEMDKRLRMMQLEDQ